MRSFSAGQLPAACGKVVLAMTMRSPEVPGKLALVITWTANELFLQGHSHAGSMPSCYGPACQVAPTVAGPRSARQALRVSDSLLMCHQI